MTSKPINFDASRMIVAALADYGLTEVAGQGSNPEILAMAAAVGAAYPSDDVSWCGLACAYWATRAGLPRPDGFLAARSWLNWGSPIYEGLERPGDVCILWRDQPGSWKGHVGLFVRRTGNLVYLLGGNQGNTVEIAAFKAERVLGIRRWVDEATEAGS